MFKILLSCLFVLQLTNLVVYSERTCNDCQVYYNCKAAVDHSRYKQDDETRKLFQRAVCGSEFVDDEVVFKVCCSDFPTLPTPVPDKVLENSRINKASLLPTKCGNILENQIVSDNIAKLYEFPWMVLISYETRDGLQFKCGGTIINSKYILTAAHCVDEHIAGVRIGEYDINTDLDCEYDLNRVICEEHIQDMHVKDIIPHENYNKFTPMNDIALLRVDGEILFNYTNVDAICLPVTPSLRQLNLDNQIGTVAGWGFTETSSLSKVLLKVEVPVKTDAQCKIYYNKYNFTVQNQFCAGELNKDSCGGDSGGPLMLKTNYHDVNSYVQYGIVSYGPRVCGSLTPGVYTDVRKYVDWILDNIKE